MDATTLRMSNPQLANREALRARIAQAFGGDRGVLADQAGQGVRDYNAMRLAEESEKAAREAGFQMARTGQYGGSQDLENQKARARIEDDTLRATEQDALSASNTFRANDASARARLEGQVNAGLGSGDAITQALQGLQFQNDNALDQIKGRALGDAMTQFGNLSQAYQLGDARQRARFAWGSGGGSSAGSPYTGTVYRG